MNEEERKMMEEQVDVVVLDLTRAGPTHPPKPLSLLACTHACCIQAQGKKKDIYIYIYINNAKMILLMMAKVMRTANFRAD
jgi:hypothetical protein